MKTLETLIPPPLVALIFSLALWCLSYFELGFSFKDIISNELRISSSVLMLVIGVAFSVSGVISFKKAKTTVNPLKPHEASSLVNTGIYQLTRNPMYVGFVFLLIALSIFLGTFFIIILLPAFVIYLTYFQIIPEERALVKLFGNEFLQYQSKVRRWL